MKLNNKKIDLILKLIMYMLPLIIVLFKMLSYGDTGSQDFNFYSIFVEQFALTSEVEGSFGVLTLNFLNWFMSNISSSQIVIIICVYLLFYVPVVEFAILFKNCLVWLFKVANDFIERGVGK